MTQSVLCLVALLFVLWVIVLKAQMTDLENKIKKLQGELVALRARGQVDLGRDVASWGKRK